MPDDKPVPQPAFPHRAYGVDVTWFGDGDEGGFAARGHVPELRFLAACNHLARTSVKFSNAVDDTSAKADEWLVEVAHVWALPEMTDNPDEWYVSWGGTTADTPGVVAMTIWTP